MRAARRPELLARLGRDDRVWRGDRANAEGHGLLPRGPPQDPGEDVVLQGGEAFPRGEVPAYRTGHKQKGDGRSEWDAGGRRGPCNVADRPGWMASHVHTHTHWNKNNHNEPSR